MLISHRQDLDELNFNPMSQDGFAMGWGIYVCLSIVNMSAAESRFGGRRVREISC